MDQQKELMMAVSNLETALSGAGPEKAAFATLDPADLCKTYRKIKPYLEGVLGLIEKLPWGKAVVAAVRVLMAIADRLCPA